MKIFNYTIQDILGVHARPAGLLVKLAKSFNCEITIKKDDKSADAKKILSVMSMAIQQGNYVEIICNGDDESDASNALEAFFKENL